MRRAASGLDFNMLSKAMTRPGIDPRSWCSLAIVQSVVIDEAAGVFCDVLLMPSKRRETARLGAAYAGSGFGFYAPVRVDDEVLVSAPGGDPAQGLVITQRLWSPADVPPAGLEATPEDVVLVVEADKSLRLTVQGGGDVVVTAADGKVKLGGEAATKPVALGNTITAAGDKLVPGTMAYWMAQVTTAINALIVPIVLTAPSDIGTIPTAQKVDAQ
jgi:Type VI secretion system/phage-baseplate injector OB domain